MNLLPTIMYPIPTSTMKKLALLLPLATLLISPARGAGEEAARPLKLNDKNVRSFLCLSNSQYTKTVHIHLLKGPAEVVIISGKDNTRNEMIVADGNAITVTGHTVIVQIPGAPDDPSLPAKEKPATPPAPAPSGSNTQTGPNAQAGDKKPAEPSIPPGTEVLGFYQISDAAAPKDGASAGGGVGQVGPVTKGAQPGNPNNNTDR